ncbi:hypothetical protein BC833DRAFT_610577 [Globomyces pollinis-pini]|nr:hypothetical protein BC833DRAFT_610577 [Globomyces pollinis-pini]
MKTKAYNNAKMGMDLGYDNRNTLDLINPKSTPTECMLKHQAYVECKISLMNPRKRFRAPYGGVIDPDLLDKETNKL